MIASITPEMLSERKRKGPVELIDVRMPTEFQEMHIPFARCSPLDSLDVSDFKRKHGAGPVYVVCRSGSRGRQACEKLVSSGIEAINVEGGTLAWEAAGFPVVRGQKAMSLERQVRIAAGLLVFTGTVLGFFVHPYWIALPAFMGAGLVFSGITDFCGMAILLGRMPWNRCAAALPSPSETTDACSLKAPNR